ncbi:MAG: Dabb family protein [Phycisphaeraceae bacterium]
MFIHSVYFWLKPGITDEDEATFRRELDGLRGIESLRTMHVGTSAASDRPVVDTSYSYALITIFDDAAAHDAYQVHPLHDRFREQCERYWDRVVIYDVEGQ